MEGGKVWRIRPQQTEGAELPGEAQPSARRRGRRSKTGQRVEKRVQRLQMAMVIAICGCVLVVLGAGLYIERVRGEKETTYRDALLLERELSVATAALESVTRERDELVNDRIPGLQPLIYDDTIQVGDHYVRNVIFTLTAKDDSPSYEYRVVFSNDSLSTVIPDLQIVLFNELGIQLGSARVPVDSLAIGELSFTLEPGEVRTHSGAIELFSHQPPQYFVLQVD